MFIMNRAAPPVVNQVLPAEVIEGLMLVVSGARAIEAWLGGISNLPIKDTSIFFMLLFRILFQSAWL